MVDAEVHGVLFGTRVCNDRRELYPLELEFNASSADPLRSNTVSLSIVVDDEVRSGRY